MNHYRALGRLLAQALSDIGLQALTFTKLRDKSNDVLLTKYGIPDISPSAASSAGASSTAGAASTATDGSAVAGGAATTSPGSKTASSATSKTKAVATTDPRSVRRQLVRFTPVGPNRDKLVTLLKEARRLDLSKCPHAFCFLLRSMFEISAKAYCRDHAKSGGPAASKASGEERALVEILRDITTHLTKNGADKAAVKMLHGAMAELANRNGLLSVTSMNQLVHNPQFSVVDGHISTLFGNIYPLLEAMNA